MSSDERKLIVETLAEMKELKGEMREFKNHVITRVENLEKKEGERKKVRLTVIAVIISAAALVVNFFDKIFKGGK